MKGAELFVQSHTRHSILFPAPITSLNTSLPGELRLAHMYLALAGTCLLMITFIIIISITIILAAAGRR